MTLNLTLIAVNAEGANHSPKGPKGTECVGAGRRLARVATLRA